MNDALFVGVPAPAALSGDGAWLALPNVDGSVDLHDTRTGTVWRRLPGHRYAVREIVVGPDDRWLATTDGTSVGIWDVGSERCLRMVDAGGPYVGLVADPAGRWVAACTSPRSVAVIPTTLDTHAPSAARRLVTQVCHRLVLKAGQVLHGGAFTDARCLVDSGGDRIVSLGELESADHGGQRIWHCHIVTTWSAATQDRLAEHLHAGKRPLGVLDPDGRWLVTVSADNTRILDPATMCERTSIRGATAPVTAVAADLDTGWLAVGHASGAVRMLRPGLTAVTPNAAEPIHAAEIVDLDRCYTPRHSRWVLTRTDRSLAVRDTSTGAVRHVLAGDRTGKFLNGRPLAGCVTTDGSLAYTVDDDGTVRTWDPDSGRQVATEPGEVGEGFVLDEVPLGWLATTVGGRLRLRDQRGRLCHEVTAQSEVPAVAAHGGDWLAIQFNEGIDIRNAHNGAFIEHLPGETGPAVIRGAHGPRLLTMNVEQRVLMRDPAGTEPTRALDASTARATLGDRVVAVDPAGCWFVHTRGATLERRDLAGGAAVVFDGPDGAEPPRACAVSPDGRLLAAVDTTGLLRVVAVPDDRTTVTVRVDSSLQDVCWLPDCTTILAVGSAGAYLLAVGLAGLSVNPFRNSG